MNIRQAKICEVKVLQDLNDELFVDNYKYDSDLKIDWAKSKTGKKYFKSIIKNKDAICLIAEDNSNPIGYIAAASKKDDSRLSKYIEIENMGVSPKHRSRGVGSLLIKQCLKIAKKKGYQKAYVNSYYSNSKAILFYENIGFQKIDISLEKTI